MRFTALHHKNWLATTFVAIGIVTIFFFHIWQITDLPRGLYVDESSIGYNAALIAQTSRDEHGVRMPIYFRAFGEYKHPIFIYATALLYRVFGIHEFFLRLTSVLFFALFWGVMTLLTHKLYQKMFVTMFVTVATGTLPWFFPMSRIGFEVVSQAPITAAALLFLYFSFHRNRRQDVYAVLTGVLLGLSLYTYSSCKLLVPLQLAGLWLIYFHPTNIKRLILATIACGLIAIPALQFTLTHPGAFSTRFRTVTYLYDNTKSVQEKAREFTANYLRQLGPTFLIWSGDTNLRHATGYAGELFGIVAILAVTGLGYVILNHNTIRHRRLYRFLVFSVFIAPIPAALTTGDTGHSLRTVLLGIVLLLLASFGLHQLLQHMRTHTRDIFLIAVFSLLLLEAGLYLHHYFTVYPKTTITWFESYGFKQALDAAISQKPEHIIVSSQSNAPYIQARFYGETLRNLNPTQISVGLPKATPNTCLIYFFYNQVQNPGRLTPSFTLADPHTPVQLQCFTGT